MNLGTVSRLKIRKPKWIIANLVETTQAATDNALKGYDRINKIKGELDKKKAEMTPSTRTEHSFAAEPAVSKAERLQRDVFGATILPSNLSFDNMKKLSMNQIKLEEIPLVDENNAAEVLVAEKMKKEAEAVKAQPVEEVGKRIEEEKDSLAMPQTKDEMVRCQHFLKADPFEEIPGPRLFQGLASMLSLLARHVTVYFMLGLLRNGYLDFFRKYGSIFKLPELLGSRILIVSRPEHISAVYEINRRNPKMSCLEAVEFSRLRRYGRHKNDSQELEAEWEETKKAIDEVLLKDEEKYFDAVEEYSNCLMRRIRILKNRENEVPEQFDVDIKKWSLECLMQIVFDKCIGFLDADDMKAPSKNFKLFSALERATYFMEQCERGFQTWRLMSTTAATALDLSCHTAEDILSHHVYEAQMNLLNKEDDLKGDSLTLAEGLLLQDGMTKKDVITNILDILLIGMNTMTTSLSFLLYHLAVNPRAQSELFKEIKGIMPEKYSRLEYDQLRSLKYLQACLKESLRLKMPMPVMMKTLHHDIVLSNYQVPRGTFVLMAGQTEALKEENFDAALEFRPSRWLDKDSKHPFTSLPLGAFNQSSFETRLAEVSVMTCVAQIIRNFSVEYRYGTMDASMTTISYPRSPLKFSFFERES